MINDLGDPWAPLRELKTRIRHLETASPLENSSVQRGGLRVLTEDGAPLAVVGHFEGKSGLVIPRAADWLTVQEYIDAEAAEERERVDGLISDVYDGKDGQDGLNGLNGRMGTVEAKATTNATNITNVTTRVTNVENKSTTNETNISNVTTRVTNVEAKATTNATTIGHVQGELTAVKATANSAKAAADDHAVKILENKQEISGLLQRLLDLVDDMEEFAEGLGLADTNISNVTTRVTNVEAKATTNATTIGHVQGELAGVKSTANAAKSATDAQGPKIAANEESLAESLRRLVSAEAGITLSSNRHDATESWRNSTGPVVNKLVTDMADVPDKISESHEYPNAKIDAINAWRNEFGPTVNSHGTRLDSHASRLGATESATSAAHARANSAHSLADSAYDLAAGKASASALNQLSKEFHEHMNYYHQG